MDNSEEEDKEGKAEAQEVELEDESAVGNITVDISADECAV